MHITGALMFGNSFLIKQIIQSLDFLHEAGMLRSSCYQGPVPLCILGHIYEANVNLHHGIMARSWVGDMFVYPPPTRLPPSSTWAL